MRFEPALDAGRPRGRGLLVRLGVNTEGRVILDVLSRLPGRGAYLCRETARACLAAARRRRAISRALHVGAAAVDHDELDQRLAVLEEDPSPR